MNEKILTISIAAYNAEKFIGKAIESVLNLSVVDDIELIIVNDGSSDNTFKIAEEYRIKYPNTIFVIDKTNGGYGSTINSSVKIAKGKYFKQLDADDWYVNDNLAHFIDYLKKTEADLVVTPFFKYFETTKNIELIDIHSNIPSEETMVQEVEFKGNLAMHELAVKLPIMREITITEKCFYTDNEYTFFPLIKAKTISYYGNPIYVYRIGREGQSVSLAGARKHYKDTMKVAQSLIGELRKDFSKWSINIVHIKINYIVDTVYTYYLCSDSVSAKEELMEFDAWLKSEDVFLYKYTSRIKKVRFLRLTRFAMFKVLGEKLASSWD